MEDRRVHTPQGTFHIAETPTGMERTLFMPKAIPPYDSGHRLPDGNDAHVIVDRSKIGQSPRVDALYQFLGVTGEEQFDDVPSVEAKVYLSLNGLMDQNNPGTKPHDTYKAMRDHWETTMSDEQRLEVVRELVKKEGENSGISRNGTNA